MCTVKFHTSSPNSRMRIMSNADWSYLWHPMYTPVPLVLLPSLKSQGPKWDPWGAIHSLCNAQSTQFFKNLNFMKELAHITQQPASMCPKWPICFLESDNFRYCSIRSWVRETIGNRRVLPATNGNLSRNGNTFSAKNGPITLTLASPQNTTSYSLVISSIMNVFHAYVSRFFCMRRILLKHKRTDFDVAVLLYLFLFFCTQT